MAAPNSRQTLIEYSLRQLGAPVVDINVDWQQCEDRLDDALQQFSERHFDGVEKAFFLYPVTAQDIVNEYINTDNLGPVNGFGGDGPTGADIVTVVKLFQFGPFGNISMFDVRYQMALTDYFGINTNLMSSKNMGLAQYDSTKRYINLIQDMFQPEKTIRFSKVTNKLHVEMNWQQELTPGANIMIEAYVLLNPDKFTEIYNDRLLKKYLTALIKRQWGMNMAKFGGVILPGGVTLRGPEIVAEAQNEIALIEQQIQLEYELPINFMIG
jgi:hypothetical protein